MFNSKKIKKLESKLKVLEHYYSLVNGERTMQLHKLECRIDNLEIAVANREDVSKKQEELLDYQFSKMSEGSMC